MHRVLFAAAMVVASVAVAQTNVGAPVDPQRAERCAVRLGIALTGKSPAGHWALLGLTALIISPLGYLLTPSLTDLADKAAASLFLAV